MAINLGFVVGCAKYENAGISNLDFADDDAHAVARLLQENCGVASDHLILLADKNPSSLFLPRRNNVIRELSAPQQNGRKLASTIDRLYFFFSGHGFHSVFEDRDYLLLQDAVPTSIEDTCISISKIVSYLKSWQAKTTILLIDACRAAPSGAKSEGDRRPISNNAALT